MKNLIYKSLFNEFQVTDENYCEIVEMATKHFKAIMTGTQGQVYFFKNRFKGDDLIQSNIFEAVLVKAGMPKQEEYLKKSEGEPKLEILQKDKYSIVIKRPSNTEGYDLIQRFSRWE